MSQKLLQLTISRVDGPVFEGQVVSVQVPGAAGEMTILANHEPLISPLRNGTITIMLENDSKQTFEVETGTMEISNNSATLLI